MIGHKKSDTLSNPIKSLSQDLFLLQSHNMIGCNHFYAIFIKVASGLLDAWICRHVSVYIKLSLLFIYILGSSCLCVPCPTFKRITVSRVHVPVLSMSCVYVEIK